MSGTKKTKPLTERVSFFCVVNTSDTFYVPQLCIIFTPLRVNPLKINDTVPGSPEETKHLDAIEQLCELFSDDKKPKDKKNSLRLNSFVIERVNKCVFLTLKEINKLIEREKFKIINVNLDEKGKHYLRFLNMSVPGVEYLQISWTTSPLGGIVFPKAKKLRIGTKRFYRWDDFGEFKWPSTLESLQIKWDGVPTHETLCLPPAVKLTDGHSIDSVILEIIAKTIVEMAPVLPTSTTVPGL